MNILTVGLRAPQWASQYVFSNRDAANPSRLCLADFLPNPLLSLSFVCLPVHLSSARRSTVQGHATGSQSSKGLYYPPHILQTVREAYGPTDYRMMASLGWWNETEPY